MPANQLANKQQVMQLVRQKLAEKPVYIDTETTGITRTDEILEIVIVDWDGSVLFESFIRPQKPIPPESTAIHGITSDMVEKARPWPIAWQQIRPLVAGRLLAMYNAEFDMRMMQQSLEQYRLPWRENFDTLDIMDLFSQFIGEWDPNRKALRRYRLEQAGKYFKIPIPNAHHALEDTLLARAVLYSMAGLPY
ncbi:MAG TPA: 3'-5' exonuclease [Anaerolineaceae bacterium]|jgi:DNA polymerase-3 subunit epsilon|nr:3'-5' exonuclease [Longilinea sp.]HNS63939.1 3'-5' exonuclease [Anaerolineaceae bacterium]HOD43582.1 3'-5' exonuclease [Anaerolineaceae bacterium]HOH19448.1 3'-5' exonuclease [Anaerolineaceae bacterium]HQF44281.1 3'-5' exonuclease [Anaerolineaceae bacterium]